jgi:zinc carboxypeptidase
LRRNPTSRSTPASVRISPQCPVENELEIDLFSERDDSPLPDLSWFDSYHAYDDHKQFFLDLNAAFPNNSEIFTAGESYEGRDIYGIHFWGKDGKDAKPVISWHATVHAREWAAAPVSDHILTLHDLALTHIHRLLSTSLGS